MNANVSDQDIVILGGARTPFGDFGGALEDVSTVDLGAHAGGQGIAVIFEGIHG
ncbi:MAG TPA: hypothetical protein VFN71_15850 [Methylomirabilota bacterium]|nr:hypothetical protein [Methylomirabilota bacterium]